MPEKKLQASSALVEVASAEKVVAETICLTRSVHIALDGFD